MLARIVAVLAGLALLGCSWWMADRNSSDPAGEVSLDVLAVGNVIVVGGDDDRMEAFLRPLGDTTRVVVAQRQTMCGGLPAIGHLLEPAPHWVAVDQADGTPACLLSGRWPLVDLVGQTDDSLRVTDSAARIQVEYSPPPGNSASLPLIDFDLRIRFPADVESASGDASVDGNTVHWSGAKALLSAPPLTASSRAIPLAQELAPWVTATLALLMIGAGALWPRSQTASAAPQLSSPPTEGAPNTGPIPSRAAGARSNPIGSTERDPDSPWAAAHRRGMIQTNDGRPRG